MRKVIVQGHSTGLLFTCPVLLIVISRRPLIRPAGQFSAVNTIPIFSSPPDVVTVGHVAESVQFTPPKRSKLSVKEFPVPVPPMTPTKASCVRMFCPAASLIDQPDATEPLVSSSVTVAPRVIASLRAKFMAASNSDEAVLTRFLMAMSRKLGTAIIAKIATIAIVTINSIRVKPREAGKYFIIGTPLLP
jgi:hypothetical protein